MSNPLVSITVTTRNEEKNIENCLKSIKLQTYHNTEIIVVDNKSTDKTKKIAKKYTSLVFDKGPERSAQRNFGMIEKSQGKYVMFVDADMIFSPDLIECSVEIMENNDFLALHIPEIVLGKKFFSQVRRFERSFYNGTVIDGARFFLRETFVKVGGFDETMSGPEDWDIDKKVKEIGRIGLLNCQKSYNAWILEKFVEDKGVNPRNFSAVIYHNEAEFNLKKYLDKKGYYSQSFTKYIEKWGKDDPDMTKQLGLWYRYFGVFLENGKWKKLFLHPILTLGMYFLRISVGLIFIIKPKK